MRRHCIQITEGEGIDIKPCQSVNERNLVMISEYAVLDLKPTTVLYPLSETKLTAVLCVHSFAGLSLMPAI